MFLKIRTLAIAIIACLLSFGVAAQAPAGWTAVSTDNNMTVMIPASILNGSQIPAGSWIGAFYTLNDGTERCGGSWQFDGTFPISVTVFGDDGLTSIKDGFTVGEEVIWKLYYSGSEYYGDDVVTENGTAGGVASPANSVKYSVNGLINGLATIIYTGDATTDYLITGTITKETGGVLRSATVDIVYDGGGVKDIARAYTDHLGTYRLYATAGTSGAVVPSMDSWGFTPADQPFTNIVANWAGVDFVAGQLTVSGTILKTDGTPMQGVSVSYVSQDGLTSVSESTNALGFYEFSLSPGATGTITASYIDYGGWPFVTYFFNPEDIAVTNLTASMADQDFVGSATPFNVNVSGMVEDEAGDPIANVAVTFTSTETTYTETVSTDVDGLYDFTLDTGESGVITPSKAGYVFTPEMITVTDVIANQVDLDFVGSIPVPVYSICGMVSNNNELPLEGVTVTFESLLLKTTITATTDVDGLYCIEGVEEGLTGIVSAAKAGYIMSPVEVAIPAMAANVADVDFMGTLETFEISGIVSDNEAKGPLAGVTVSLTGMESVITASDGAFSFTVNYGFDGTLVAEKEGYSFAPASRSYTDVMENKMNQDFVAALFTYDISGTITFEGAPLENVAVDFSGNAGLVYTDATGYYENSVTFGYSGIATPALEGYIFAPENYSYESVEADTPNQDFTASPSIYSISGAITLEGVAMEGVEVTFSNGGGMVLTDVNGMYTNTVDVGWSGVVTPEIAGYHFTPESYSYTEVAQEYVDQDFTAAINMYLISGTISEAEAAVPGVTVSFGEGIADATTNSSGYYEVLVPFGWAGTITPSKEGWVFAPETITLTNVTDAVPNQDFTGEVETFVVSGFITNSVSGTAVNGVSVSLTGAGTTTTNASGFYALVVPYGYTGTLTPFKPGYTFAPETIALTNVVANATAQNFEGTEIMYTIGGVVLDAMDAPVEDVIITFSNGAGSVLTDETGAYAVQVAYGYTGTASPLKTGYIFNPINRAYNFVTEDASAENYLAGLIPPESYTVSGTIVDESSSPMAGVSVVFTNGGGTATTDANGEYSIEIYGGYSGQATPSNMGYVFDPVSIPLTNLAGDMAGLDFQGMPSTLPPGWGYVVTGSSHLISVPNSIHPTINGIELMPGDWVGVFYMDGTTEVCGGAIMWNGISSVAVTAFGDDATTADKDGFDEGEDLMWKVYSQTAAMSFDAVATYNTSMPQFDGLYHTNGLSALTALEATGTTYTISGMVNNVDGNTPMAGVMITLTNGGGTATTDATGYYEAEVLPNWAGSATPFYMGYHFTPLSINYTAVAADQTNQDYMAAINYYTITGHITNTNGVGMAGVTVFFDNDGGSSISFPDGFYTRTVPYGYSGTAYPGLEDYSFTPETYIYSLVSENIVDQDYEGTLANLPPGWGFEPTLESHIISLPLGANPNINGVTLFPGDWIGVFYMDEGVEKCGGAVEWDGNANIPLVAYGDDDTTPGVKDGFTVGEDFSWKVYSYAADLLVEDVLVIYDEEVQNYDGTFQINGLSAILALNATTDETYTISGTVTNVIDGQPMEDVMIDLGDGGMVYTDANGYYEMEVLFGWTGAGEAVYPRYSFSPTTYGYYQIIADQDNNNYEGTRYPFPPGWEYVFTDTEHTVSVIEFALPTIDGTELVNGDFIGIFYYDENNGEEHCAGYAEWNGANTAVVAYGDDATTAQKDGLAIGEPFRWKVYSWDMANQYEAIANYDLTTPYIDGFFTVNGLSRVVNIYADPLTILATATPETICYNTTSQLEVSAAGGNGLYEYSWSPVEGLSDPTAANPVATLTETTTFTVTVSTYQYTEMQSVTVEVYDMFEVTGGDDQTICFNTTPEDLFVTAIGGAENYTYQWQMLADDEWVNVVDATVATFNPGNLTETTEYRCEVSDMCGVLYTPVITITVHADLAAVASEDQTICYNTAPEALMVTATGGAGNYSYQWYMDGVAVELGTGASYQPEALMATTEFYAVVTDDCGVVTTNTITVTVYSEFMASAAADQVICYGSTPEPIVATAMGGAGNYTYQWQVEGEDGFVDIASATEATYQPETIFDATTYQCVVTDDCGVITTNVVMITMYEDVEVVIAADQVICYYTAPEMLTSVVTGGAANYTYQWQIEGEDGFVDIATASEATYQPDALTGETHYQLVVTDDCGVFTSNMVTITIIPIPVADAGMDQEVCESSDVQLDGYAEDAGSTLWMTAGDGTFDDASLLNAVYTPGVNDMDAGDVELTLKAFAIEPCTDSDMDMVVIDFAPAPTANAGIDGVVCEGDDFQTMGFTTVANSILWSTAGDGTFDNATSTSAKYTPGTADLAAGTVVLTLGAEPMSPCTDWVYDNMTLTVIATPTADAGADATICGSGTYTLAGMATNYITTMWTTSGDGTFSNPASLTAVYTPGANDIVNGGVDLTLTAEGMAPCGVLVSDVMTLELFGTPEVYAGEAGYVCEGNDFVLSEATATNATVLWTTSGTGTFDDATLVNAAYTPSTGDLALGVVTLTITGTNGEPCNEEDVDTMDLTILNAPTINGGGDQDVCETELVSLAAVAAHFANVEWTTDGDGTFDNSNILTADYTPGHNDILSGSVTLTITAFGEGVCGNISDEVVITIVETAVVYAGEDTKVCEGSSIELTEATAANYASILWTTLGDGTFDDPSAINPTYTPGSFDISFGSVDLTITGSAMAPCSVDASDLIVLSIDKAPEAADMPTGDTHTCTYNVSSLYEVNEVTNANGYDWEITPAEAGTIAGAGMEATVTWNADYIGTCIVRVRAYNDCGDAEWSDGLEILHDNCVGIEENDAISVSVFPNPTTGLFTVSIEGINESIQLSVMNYEGQLIQRETLENVSTYEHTFNLSQYATGVYFLRLQGDNFLKVERIVVR